MTETLPRHAAIHPMQRIAGGHVLELQQQCAGVNLHDIPEGCALRIDGPEFRGRNQRCRAGYASNRGHG